jgi:hypothetical protein
MIGSVRLLGEPELAFEVDRLAFHQRQADAAVTKSIRKTLQDIADNYRVLAENEERSGAIPTTKGKGSKTEVRDARS